MFTNFKIKIYLFTQPQLNRNYLFTKNNLMVKTKKTVAIFVLIPNVINFPKKSLIRDIFTNLKYKLQAQIFSIYMKSLGCY